MRRIFVINGPNLNLLGSREPKHYGTASWPEIQSELENRARENGAEIRFFQSNHEGALVDTIQAQAAWADCFIVNGGAFTHSSIALRDALASAAKPFIEVHLSNIFKREAFRHHSYLSDIAEGMICGLGPEVYRLALAYVLMKPEQA